MSGSTNNWKNVFEHIFKMRIEKNGNGMFNAVIGYYRKNAPPRDDEGQAAFAIAMIDSINQYLYRFERDIPPEGILDIEAAFKDLNSIAEWPADKEKIKD